MKPNRFHVPTQLSALTAARLAPVNWGGTWTVIDAQNLYLPWDGGIEHSPRIARGETAPIPFFLLAQRQDAPGAVSL